MRYSVNQDDAGYSNWVNAGRHVRVLIDGMQRENVVTADEDARQALVHVLDANGCRIVDHATQTVKQEWICGTVVVLPFQEPAKQPASAPINQRPAGRVHPVGPDALY